MTPFHENDPTAAGRLLDFRDGLNEYGDVQAFLLEAFIRVMSPNDPTDDDVIAGAARCADMLRTRWQALKDDFGRIVE
jgi:hypothetical protein